MATLVRAEYVARAADLEVLHGNLEACAKLCRGEHGLEALLRRLGEAAVLGNEQVGVGATGAASDAATKLVELGESEGVGAVDDKGVDVWDVEAGLDDGGAYEDVHVAGGEVDHRLLEAVLAHLAVSDADFGLGDELTDVSGDVVDVVDAVVEEVDLPAPVDLAADGLADKLVAELGDVGLDGQALFGRGLDGAHVADAGEG